MKIYADQLFVWGLHPRLFEPPHRWYMSYLHPSYSPDCCIISSLSLTILFVSFSDHPQQNPAASMATRCPMGRGTLCQCSLRSRPVVPKLFPCCLKVVSNFLRSFLKAKLTTWPLKYIIINKQRSEALTFECTNLSYIFFSFISPTFWTSTLLRL